MRAPRQMNLSRGPLGGGMGGGAPMGGMGGAQAPAVPGSAPISGVDKVGRNDLCPCGSGKKYKKCHGQ